MSAAIDDVHAQAAEVARARSSDANGVVAAEQELLRRLGALMKTEESCFDPVSGTARILEGSDGKVGVRLDAEGAWKAGAAPERDLVDAWGGAHGAGDGGAAPVDLPTLRELLEAIPRAFASARVGAVVDAVRATLYPS
jgi:hypothetical protein